MSVLIRRASLTDARGIAEVHAASWKDAYRELLPAWYLRGLETARLTPRWQWRLASRAGVEIAWVAVDSERGVIAFVTAAPARRAKGFEGHAGEISELYVAPSDVGHGIGSALFARAVRNLERTERRWLVVSVLEKNERARRFYEKHGLRFGGTRWVDRSLERSVVLYERPLNVVFDFATLRR